VAFAVLFGIIVAASLAAGAVRRRQIADFVASDRPMARWTYTPQESARIRAERWDGERGDWRLQFGCLTGLFGLVGVLVGLLGFLSGELNPIVPVAAGVATGAAVGSVVAVADYAGGRAERSLSTPIAVALGVGEFLYDGEYFCERGAEYVIESMHLEDGARPALVIETWSHPWFQRTPREQQWAFPVPPERLDDVRRLVETTRA